jgi:hypothetical protein
VLFQIDSTFRGFLSSLGKGNRLFTIISSLVLALCFFFYVYAVGSFFNTIVGVLQDRVVYIVAFQSHVITEHIDYSIIISLTAIWMLLCVKGKGRFVITALYTACAIAGTAFEPRHIVFDAVALASVPIIVGLSLLYPRLLSNKNLIDANRSLTINYLALIGIVTGIAAIIVSSLTPLFAIQLESIPVRHYVYEIFSLLSSSFSPFLMILLIFCLPVKLLLNEFSKKLLSNESSKFDQLFRPYGLDSKIRISCLVLVILLCIVLVLIPHQTTINRDGQRVGTDTHYYVNWTSTISNAESFNDAVGEAFTINGGDRPLTLLFLSNLVKIVDTNTVALAIEYTPIILGPLLVLVTYFLTRELTSGNELTSLVAAFLTSVSFQILVGIFAGFYANWIAVIFGYASLVFLFRFLKSNRKFNFTAFTVLSIMVLLSHVYTWTILALVTVFILIVMLKLDYYDKKRTYFLLLSVFTCVVIDLLRAAITNTPPGIQYQIDNSIRIINERGHGSFTENFFARWDNIIEVHKRFLAIFSNFIITGLGVYWLVLSKLRNRFTILMIAFLSVGVLPLFVGDWLLQSRVIYEVPFQISAALALTYIFKRPGGNVVVLAVCIWLVAISVYDVSNLYSVDRSS